MRKHSPIAGFTMFELLIVMAFIAIIGSVGIGYYFNYQRQTILRTTADNIQSFLYITQQRSIGQEDASQWGVHFENPAGGNKPFYASFKGATYTAPVETRFLDAALDFAYPAEGESVDIVFSRINGKVADGIHKKVYVSLNPGAAVRGINVSPFGVITLNDGEVGWWRMNEGSGTTTGDSSGYGNNGTFVGAPAWQSEANCKEGQCLTFSPGNYISLGNPDTLKITGSQTISMWLKPGVLNDGVRRNPYAKAYGGEGTITQEPDGRLNYYYGTSGGNASPYQGFGSGNILVAGQWAHVVLVRDLSAMKLYWYKDGVQATSVNATYAAATAGGNTAYIGHGYTSDYQGEIDDVRIYDRAFSEDEVKHLYETTK